MSAPSVAAAPPGNQPPARHPSGAPPSPAAAPAPAPPHRRRPPPITPRMALVDRLLTEVTRAKRGTRLAARVAGAAIVLALALQLGSTVAGLAPTAAYGAVVALGSVATFAALALRAATADSHRASWIVLTVGVGCWMGGAVLGTAGGQPGDNSAVEAGDVLYLTFYPCAYAAVALRTRVTLHRFARTVWMDGLVGVLSVGAVGWVLVIGPFVASAPGRHAATIVNCAYVAGDFLLVSLAVGALALHGWRAGRGWALLAIGFAVFASGDLLWLLRVAHGAYTPGSRLGALWAIGIFLLATSAWQDAPGRPGSPTIAVLLTPFGFALGALGVLVYGGLYGAPTAAVLLATGAAIASMGRTALTFTDIRRLAEIRRQATTDDLTGLPNRRHLDRSLQRRLEAAKVRGASLALLLIDLDGFKELNDTLGHRAGDLVLEQIGPRLRAVLRSGDELPRLGGDEFAVVLSDTGDAEAVGRRMRQALEAGLTIDGIDVRIGASIGIALFPEHGDDAETLLQ